MASCGGDFRPAPREFWSALYAAFRRSRAKAVESAAKAKAKPPEQAVVDKRVPAFVAEASFGQKNVKTVKEGISLKARMQMIKEDIIREATTRMLRLHENEEMWALDQAIAALGGHGATGPASDAGVQACREILAERRRLVRQRLDGAERLASSRDGGGDGRSAGPSQAAGAAAVAAEAPHEARSAAEASAAGGKTERCPSTGGAEGIPAARAHTGTAATPLVTAPSQPPDIMRASYWSHLTGLTVCGSADGVDDALRAPLWPGGGRIPVGVDAAKWASDLGSAGWANTGVLGEAFAEAAGRLHAAALRLREAGWPPVFVFMADEAWNFAAHVQDVVGALLAPVAGDAWRWHFEPSFAAFLLDEGHKDGTGKRLGNSFPLPHRDHSYSSSFDADGVPKLVSAWVPLTDVEVDNGCMYVVPREFDPTFDSDAAYEHMQLVAEQTAVVEAELSAEDSASAPQRLTMTSVCGFPLAGARPLPCRQGSVLAWNTNVIHWGSFCHSAAASPPRCSLAFVFRRCRPSPAEPAADSLPPAGETADTAGLPVQICDPEAEPMDLRDARTVASLATVRRRLMYVLAALRYFEHWYDATAVRDQVMRALRDKGNAP